MMLEETMRVEVVIYTPDDSPEMEAYFIDGEKVTSIEVTHLDPGRGWTRQQWRDFVEHEAELSTPAAAELIREWGRDAERSPFIREA